MPLPTSFGAAVTRLCLVAVILAPAAPLAAQRVAPALGSGARVRVTLFAPSTGTLLRAWALGRPDEGQQLTGTVVSMGPSEIDVEVDAGRFHWNDTATAVIPIPLSRVMRLEVSSGREVSALRVGMGALIGFLVGSSIGQSGTSCQAGATCTSERRAWAGAAIGTALGALSGAVWRKERWDPAPVVGSHGLGTSRPLGAP
ncbi:MAG: hypothetical protein NVS4B3_10720 [Gemmatimonadaceae bacterium]